MAKIRPAMPTIYKHEGSYSNDQNDPGGATQFGISLRFLKGTGDLDKDGWPDGDLDHDYQIDINDIMKMTTMDAEKLYEDYFWKPNKYDLIDNQDIATKVFDLAVNMGSIGANKCLQRAVRATNGTLLVEDGKIGKQTLDAVNICSPLTLMAALKSEAASVYRLILAKNTKLELYRLGWLNRAYDDPI